MNIDESRMLHDAGAHGKASRWRIGVFVVVLAASIAGALAYAMHVTGHAKTALATAPAVATTGINVLPVAASRPYLLFRSTALGETYGRVGLQYLGDKAGERIITPLQCDRVHFSSGRGVCLTVRPGVPATYRAHVFNDRFEIVHSYPLAGPPSRARMSPDGRLAAFTVFVSGHTYSGPGFTTRTSIVDAVSGKMIADDLEKFQVLRDGQPFTAADFNFWGVSFNHDGTRFYATVATAGKVSLVEGDIAARRMQVIHDNVECPSLSPDETRVAFKRRVAADRAGRIVWRLHVLDLASRKETALVEEYRDVDDQVEWLSEREIVYAMPDDETQATAATHVWALSVDGMTAPRRLLPFAFSPAVVNRSQYGSQPQQ